jgi:hypothetical protein
MTLKHDLEAYWSAGQYRIHNTDVIILPSKDATLKVDWFLLSTTYNLLDTEELLEKKLYSAQLLLLLIWILSKACVWQSAS